MGNVVTVMKAGVAIAALVLLCVTLPIWGATGSLQRAWNATRRYCLIVGLLMLIGACVAMLAVPFM